MFCGLVRFLCYLMNSQIFLTYFDFLELVSLIDTDCPNNLNAKYSDRSTFPAADKFLKIFFESSPEEEVIPHPKLFYKNYYLWMEITRYEGNLKYVCHSILIYLLLVA